VGGERIAKVRKGSMPRAVKRGKKKGDMIRQVRGAETVKKSHCNNNVVDGCVGGGVVVFFTKGWRWWGGKIFFTWVKAGPTHIFREPKLGHFTPPERFLEKEKKGLSLGGETFITLCPKR